MHTPLQPPWPVHLTACGDLVCRKNTRALDLLLLLLLLRLEWVPDRYNTLTSRLIVCMIGVSVLFCLSHPLTTTATNEYLLCR